MELQSTAAHDIFIAAAFVNTPGKINIADICHFSLRTTALCRAPGAYRSVPKVPKNGGLPGVWEFENSAARCGTTAMIPATKNGGLQGVWEFELDKNTRARPVTSSDLSTGYPQVILRGVWEFAKPP